MRVAGGCRSTSSVWTGHGYFQGSTGCTPHPALAVGLPPGTMHDDRSVALPRGLGTTHVAIHDVSNMPLRHTRTAQSLYGSSDGMSMPRDLSRRRCKWREGIELVEAR
jgi:hypothetical protein